MAKAKTNTSRCKACRYCVKACPKDAITVMNTVNKKGYEPVQVDEEKCIGCGACYAVCPDYVFEII
jgi:2-oxoglutarate ferredoxin oxidoreductase subunit delta